MYHEVLNQNEKFNAEVLTSIRRISQKMAEKSAHLIVMACYPYTIMQEHILLVIQEHIMVLNMEVFTHPPYSPGLASSDYHSFLDRCNIFRRKIVYKLPRL